MICNNSPIIIIGMHRSGTTMITNHLERLGLYVSDRKDSNNEAFFFLNLNEWLFKQCKATWDSPTNFVFLNNNLKLKNELISTLNFHLSSISCMNYLGVKKYLKYGSIRNLDILWGWKDPRNTFTVDLWKKIFSKCKNYTCL